MTLQLAIATAIAIVTPAAAAAGHAAAVASAASAVAASHAAAAAAAAVTLVAAAAAAVAARQGGALNSIVPAAVDLAIIVLLLVTRARGRPLEPARLLAGPLLLIAIGIGSSTPALHGAALHGATWHGIDYLIVGLDLLDSLLVGTIRGFTVRLYQRDGAPWYRYGPVTVALWLLSILIRVGLAVLGAAHHASPLAEGSDLLFMLGLALLCQNVVVVQRYARRQRACGWR